MVYAANQGVAGQVRRDELLGGDAGCVSGRGAIWNRWSHGARAKGQDLHLVSCLDDNGCCCPILAGGQGDRDRSRLGAVLRDDRPDRRDPGTRKEREQEGDLQHFPRSRVHQSLLCSTGARTAHVSALAGGPLSIHRAVKFTWVVAVASHHSPPQHGRINRRLLLREVASRETPNLHRKVALPRRGHRGAQQVGG